MDWEGIYQDVKKQQAKHTRKYVHQKIDEALDFAFTLFSAEIRDMTAQVRVAYSSSGGVDSIFSTRDECPVRRCCILRVADLFDEFLPRHVCKLVVIPKRMDLLGIMSRV